MDRLSTLLSQFGVRANLFYNGKLCGMALCDGADQRGHIQLLQAGSVTLLGPDRKDLLLTQPSLIFCQLLLVNGQSIARFEGQSHTTPGPRNRCINCGGRTVGLVWLLWLFEDAER